MKVKSAPILEISDQVFLVSGNFISRFFFFNQPIRTRYFQIFPVVPDYYPTSNLLYYLINKFLMCCDMRYLIRVYETTIQILGLPHARCVAYTRVFTRNRNRSDFNRDFPEIR